MSRDLTNENAQLIEMVKSLSTRSVSVNATGIELEHRLNSVLAVVNRLIKSCETKHQIDLRAIEAELSESFGLRPSSLNRFSSKIKHNVDYIHHDFFGSNGKVGSRNCDL